MKQLEILFVSLSCILSLYAQEPEIGSVIDKDGNIYKTISIGNYEWMAEDLKTTTYNNGIKIPNIAESFEWTRLNSGAYCWYNNDESNAAIYGALYNWYTVNTGNLCPNGWRVPSDEEWKYLEGYVDNEYAIGDEIWNKTGLRGFDIAMGLKARSGWDRDGNGLDRFGFKALPGGERLSWDGRFFLLGLNGFWWTCDEDKTNENKALYRGLIYAYDQMMRYTHDKTFGFSVRCIRDR